MTKTEFQSIIREVPDILASGNNLLPFIDSIKQEWDTETLLTMQAAFPLKALAQRLGIRSEIVVQEARHCQCFGQNPLNRIGVRWINGAWVVKMPFFATYFRRFEWILTSPDPVPRKAPGRMKPCFFLYGPEPYSHIYKQIYMLLLESGLNPWLDFFDAEQHPCQPHIYANAMKSSDINFIFTFDHPDYISQAIEGHKTIVLTWQSDPISYPLIAFATEIKRTLIGYWNNRPVAADNLE